MEWLPPEQARFSSNQRGKSCSQFGHHTDAAGSPCQTRFFVRYSLCRVLCHDLGVRFRSASPSCPDPL